MRIQLSQLFFALVLQDAGGLCPTFPTCSVISLPSGEHIQLVPKIATPDKIGSSMIPIVTTNSLVCLLPDCLRNPCEHCRCEETLDGYACHCTSDITGIDGDNGNFTVFVAMDGAILTATTTPNQSLLNATYYELPLEGLDVPSTASFDPVDGMVYWIDRDTISRAYLNGSNQELIANITGCSCELVLDIDGRKIYWSEKFKGRIKRSELNGSGAEILIQQQKYPGGLAIDRANGYLFWKGQKYIMRSTFEGENQTAIVSWEIKEPTCISWNPEASRLFWIDKDARKMESINSDGTDRSEVFSWNFSAPIEHIHARGYALYWTSPIGRIGYLGQVSLLDPNENWKVKALKGHDRTLDLTDPRHVHIYSDP